MMQEQQKLVSLVGCLLAVFIGYATLPGALAHDGHHHAGADQHEAIRRSEAQYVVPRASLIREDGATVDIVAELSDGQPVFLNFIYTSCTSVCPLMSQTFSGLGEELAASSRTAKLISVSIDPENDTPARLQEYSGLIGASREWHFYTGNLEDSVRLQKAFGTYAVDKMNHPIAAFYYPGKGRKWLRIDGFATAKELANLTHRAGQRDTLRRPTKKSRQ